MIGSISKKVKGLHRFFPRRIRDAAQKLAAMRALPYEIVFYIDPDTLLRTDPPPKGSKEAQKAAVVAATDGQPATE